MKQNFLKFAFAKKYKVFWICNKHLNQERKNAKTDLLAFKDAKVN